MNKIFTKLAKPQPTKISRLRVLSSFVLAFYLLLPFYSEAQTYCIPSTGNVDVINSFTLSNVTNPSSGGGVYQNFTALTINLVSGQMYTPKMLASGGNTAYAVIWIDINNNGTFEDSEIISTGSANPGTAGNVLLTTFLTPSSLGTHRMRVKWSYYPNSNTSGINNPCDLYTSSRYGQFEDYTVNITNSSSSSNTSTFIPSISTGQNNTPFGAYIVTQSYEWTVPTDVYAITVEAVGGGGEGGSGWGGGGGGAYSMSTIEVTPGEKFTIQAGGGGRGGGWNGNGITSSGLNGTPTGVNALGSDSYLKRQSNNQTLVLAKGGAMGAGANSDNASKNNPALGGQAANGIGQIKTSGGNSGAVASNRAGGGGGAGGLGNNGENGRTGSENDLTGAYGGSGNPGYFGGRGAKSANGFSGDWFGGGGGGITSSGGKGGSGGPGTVIITYKAEPKLSDPIMIYIGDDTLCPNATATIKPRLPIGGTISETGNDILHKFTNTEIFNTPVSISGAKMLLVGAGGGGGANGGGGGGAGEFIYKTDESINIGFSSIIVGQEGTSASLNNETGFRGGVSYFENKYKANGGGGGASRDGGGRAMTGGSGGGGSNANSNNPPHQQGNISLKLDGGSGNSGGTGEYSTNSWSWFGGGGGGAGSAGVSTSGGARNDPGHGGNGISNSITGTSIEYAAGGAGAPSRVQSGTTTYPSDGGSNRIGGGNNGSNGIKAPNQNTGSGGSSGGEFSGIGAQAPTSGATGVVIIRYTKGIWSSSNTAIATVVTNPDGSATITAIEGDGGTSIISNSLDSSVYQYEITVSPKLTAGTIDSDQQTICYGSIPDDITYSIQPIAGSKTLNYQWYKKSGNEPAPTENFNSSGWTLVGNASNSSADLSGAEIGILNNAATFALRVTDAQHNCFDIWSGQKHVIFIDKHLTATISNMDTLASNNQAYTCQVKDNQWHYFRDDNDRVIAAINSNGQNLGNVKVEVFVENQEPINGNGSIYDISECYNNPELTAVRWYDITPEIQPLTPVAVKLFLSTAEYISYVNAINQFKQSTAPNYDYCYGITNSINDLAISKDEVADIPNIQTSVSLIPGVTEYQFDVTSFSSFKFHTNGGDGAPLPVELLSFVGYHQTNTNVLVWKTASERNTETFEIEHSVNGTDWKTIGTVAASGFSNTPLSYTYTDNNPLQGDNHYRLKMIDFDNTYEYSKIININVAANDLLSNNIISVYPNPSTDIFNILIQSSKNYIGLIQVLNVQGQIIQTLSIDIQKGENTIQINLKNLPQGLYILNSIDANGLMSIEKIIKK